MTDAPKTSPIREWVAVILAVGLAIAVNAITLASVYLAVVDKSNVPGGLSENATQVLTTAFGGIIGVLGSYMGFRAGQERGKGNGSEPP